jgi:hypothetical protein
VVPGIQFRHGVVLRLILANDIVAAPTARVSLNLKKTD